jgi:hypothetical protein
MDIRRRGVVQLGAIATLAVALTGCGGVDGVELNGKIFDALGVSTSSLGPRPEPKLEQRSPLVLPPDPNKLPEPGGGQAPAVADASWPKDRDQLKKASADEAQRKQEEYCRDGNWKEKAMKDEAAAQAGGPYGSCGSVFSVLSKTLFGAQN